MNERLFDNLPGFEFSKPQKGKLVEKPKPIKVIRIPECSKKHITKSGK